MAGDWIKFELITLDKPEVCQLADLAGIDPDAVVGKLLRVWGWFDQHTEDGNAPSVSKKLLDRLVGVTGFCDSMISVGWMVEVDGDEGHWIALPNFGRHNGETAKKRLLGAKRAASHKARGTAANAKSNAGSVTDALPREEKSRDKQQHQHAVDPRAQFELFEQWQPDEMSLKTQTKMQGVDPALITPELLAEFVSYWVNKPVADSQGGWCHRLVKRAKGQSVRAAANPSAQGQPQDWTEHEVIL